jgi:hypothetical protein
MSQHPSGDGSGHPGTKSGSGSRGETPRIRNARKTRKQGAKPSKAVEDMAPPSPADDATSGGAVADDGSGFLTALAGAMQSVVARERTRIADYTAELHRSRLDEIRERDEAERERLRTIFAHEVSAIETWVEEETTQIRREGERRQNEARDNLDRNLARHRSTFDGAVERVETAIATYRDEVNDFFSHLDGVDDPVVIAKQAVDRPAFPRPPEVSEIVGSSEAPSIRSGFSRHDDVDDTTMPGTTDAADEPNSTDVMDGEAAGKLVDASWAIRADGTAPLSTGASEDVDAGDDVPEPELIGAPARGVSGASGTLLHTMRVVRPVSDLRRDPATTDPSHK